MEQHCCQPVRYNTDAYPHTYTDSHANSYTYSHTDPNAYSDTYAIRQESSGIFPVVVRIRDCYSVQPSDTH
jgi:hypothetical protein